MSKEIGSFTTASGQKVTLIKEETNDALGAIGGLMTFLTAGIIRPPEEQLFGVKSSSGDVTWHISQEDAIKDATSR